MSARLMALADVYDALISRRVYRKAWRHARTGAGLHQRGRGKHFDPDMVDAFLLIHQEFRAIAQRFVDTDADLAAKRQYLERMRLV